MKSPSKKSLEAVEKVLDPERFYGTLWAEAREKVALLLDSQREEIADFIMRADNTLLGPDKREKLVEAIRRMGE